MLMARNVAPSGLPMCRNFETRPSSGPSVLSASVREVLSRNSCVIAMPIDANARDVRSHARNVRSKREARTVSVKFCCQAPRYRSRAGGFTQC